MAAYMCYRYVLELTSNSRNNRFGLPLFDALVCGKLHSAMNIFTNLLNFSNDSIFLTSFVYPTVAHAIWSTNGVLSAFAEEPFRGIGVVDFAGSGVIHMVSLFS